MAKGVFVHRADSVYDDSPTEHYQFPKRYLKRVLPCVGDWIVYYEPRGGGGRLGYNAIARVQKVIEDPSKKDMFLAIIEARSYIPLAQFVPYQGNNGFLESALTKPDGTLNKGLVQWAVRPISDHDFDRILQAGYIEKDDLLPRIGDAPGEAAIDGLSEAPQPFDFDTDRIRVERTISKIDRNRVFRRLVLDAYDSRCAFTGLKLINGGGRAEVEAAHIKPVADNGPDAVWNGLALSGTVHWMFDRGLISLSNDYDILISRQVNDPEQIESLVNKTGKANIPDGKMQRPHPAYLSCTGKTVSSSDEFRPDERVI
jgi:putative restriction endonuclease